MPESKFGQITPPPTLVQVVEFFGSKMNVADALSVVEEDEGVEGDVECSEQEDVYEIREKTELGDLCKMFFNTTGTDQLYC